METCFFALFPQILDAAASRDGGGEHFYALLVRTTTLSFTRPGHVI